MLRLYIFTLLLNTFVNAAPLAFESMGNKVEAMQKKCKAYSKLQSLPETIQIKCGIFILKTDKAFTIGYLLDSDVDKDQVNQKELDRYLKFLRDADEDRESILAILNREAKKALKSGDKKYYAQLKQSQIPNEVSKQSIIDSFKKEVNSEVKGSQYTHNAKYNDFIIKNIPDTSEQALAKKRDENNRKIVAEALKDLERQIEQSKRNKSKSIQVKKEKPYTENINKEQDELRINKNEADSSKNNIKPSYYAEKEQQDKIVAEKNDREFLVEPKAKDPSFIFSLSVLVFLIALALLWIRKKKTLQEIKSDTSSTARKVRTGTALHKKVDPYKSDKLLYDPIAISNKLGLPVEMIKDFVINYKNYALSIKEQLYTELQPSYQNPKKDLLNKLITDAEDLGMGTLLTILLSIQSEEDAQKKKENLDTFYIQIDKI